MLVAKLTQIFSRKYSCRQKKIKNCDGGDYEMGFLKDAKLNLDR